MDMATMDSMFGIIGLVMGGYCFYACIMMKKTGEINDTLFRGKDVMYKKCKDKAAFIRECCKLGYAMGAVLLVYGLMSLYSAYVKSIEGLLMIPTVLFFVVAVWYVIRLRKLLAEYYDIHK